MILFSSLNDFNFDCYFMTSGRKETDEENYKGEADENVFGG